MLLRTYFHTFTLFHFPLHLFVHMYTTHPPLLLVNNIRPTIKVCALCLSFYISLSLYLSIICRVKPLALIGLLALTAKSSPSLSKER